MATPIFRRLPGGCGPGPGRRMRLTLECLEARDVPSTVVAPAPDALLHRYVVGDFDGDGKADAARSVPPGAWHVLLSDGTRLAEPVRWADPAGRRGTVRVFAADFTGDGKADVARLSRAGEWVVGVSDGQSFAPAVWDVWPRVLGNSVRVGDFDGDGKADVAAMTAAGE